MNAPVWPINVRIVDAHERAIISEIRMLLGFVAGCSGMSLDKLPVNSFESSMPAPTITSVLARFEAIETAATNLGVIGLTQNEASFLLMLRDALNAYITPANGYSVAYTSMVVGNERGAEARSQPTLAIQAYPGLRLSATLHRCGHWILLGIALSVTGFAIWNSTKIAVGKALVQNVQALHQQKAAFDEQKMRLEEAFSQPGAPVIPLYGLVGDDLRPQRNLVVRLCDRPHVVSSRIATPSEALNIGQLGGKPALFETASEQDLCDKDALLARNFELVQTALRFFLRNWPALAGEPFNLFAASAKASDEASSIAPALARQPDTFYDVAEGNKDDHDVEQLVAPVILVLGNYTLPVIFAVLGASAFTILEFYTKIRTSTLVPSDHLLSWIRLTLGIVIGACIGLFFSAYGPQAQGMTGQPGLISALTLSASGVSFLAGFGVEGVFAMINGLVKRVFGAKAA